MALLAHPAFGTKSKEAIAVAVTIKIRLKDDRATQVDDDLTWYAEDEAVFNEVVPVAEAWPHDDYYPLPLLRAHAIATWVAREAHCGGRHSQAELHAGRLQDPAGSGGVDDGVHDRRIAPPKGKG